MTSKYFYETDVVTVCSNFVEKIYIHTLQNWNTFNNLEPKFSTETPTILRSINSKLKVLNLTVAKS